MSRNEQDSEIIVNTCTDKYECAHKLNSSPFLPNLES